jgi:hypothetical protein
VRPRFELTTKLPQRELEERLHTCVAAKQSSIVAVFIPDRVELVPHVHDSFLVTAAHADVRGA